ncbi:2-dehydro-3-deoxygalactonokinase [Novosphingobium sp. 9U]|uniref:2-dehydro-3-deoxygalactonokinase n=1 Tax=Novosphingobium sp. 9U TaxID=2653158 RepID=UPI0012F2CEB9|nr:2-dehydro-3-deoxygalactonokinase [Novosphingobium sp. 9U]VWX46733.1 2-dehydro-3-deoxygalactonokinase [Novosphingobium sp. 9U]
MSIRAEILGDWGTSNLRLWLRFGGAVAERRDGRGVGALAANAAQQLRDLTAAWREAYDISVIVLCGMAGARGGLHETGYVECPASAADWAGRAARTEIADTPVTIGSGLAFRDRDGRDDVMRGEETQVFGALRLHPELAIGRATMLLPGTHSKWVTLDGGRVTGLRTFITGELYALLSRSSLFATGGADESGHTDEEGFAQGMAEGRNAPGLTGSLFQARAGQLRQGRSAAWARSYLSGLLLASEVAQMQQLGMLPNQVTMIGAHALCERYRTVLASAGVATRLLDDEACTLAGLELILAHD